MKKKNGGSKRTNNGGTWGDFGGAGVSSSNGVLTSCCCSGGWTKDGLMNMLTPRHGDEKGSKDIGDWSGERPGPCAPNKGDTFGNNETIPFGDWCRCVDASKDDIGERAGSWGEVDGEGPLHVLESPLARCVTEKGRLDGEVRFPCEYPIETGSA